MRLSETRSSPGLPRWQVTARLILFFLATSTAVSQAPIDNVGPWNLRVCADPAGYPLSTDSLEGYENRVAEILAEDLGATVSYEWTMITDATVRDLLKRGACDAVMSTGEGAMGLLNTVVYQRIPDVFLYLTEAGFLATSLYDTALAELRIGAQPNSSMNSVLFGLGLVDNFVGIQPDASKRGYERIRPSVDALLAGEIDVAIVSGAFAAYFVEQHPETFSMSVVEPELVPPLTPTFYMATIGVRPRDEGLRDALNQALARRWTDVQAAFGDVGVPLLDSPPVLAAGSPEGVISIGVIAPFPTGFAAGLDDLADSAYYGARLADDLVVRQADRSGIRVDIIYANAPSTESALRAFDRLLAVNKVAAVVVAHDAETTAALAARAASTAVPILNALAGDSELRSKSCYPNLFHVAPSNSMYVSALAKQASSLGLRSATVVTNGSPALSSLGELAKQLLESEGVVVTTVEVADAVVIPYADLVHILAQGSEGLVIVLPPTPQSLFLGDLDREGTDVPVLGFPWPIMQTREFYLRLGVDSPGIMATPRVSGWDATVSEHGADEANLRFSSRSARSMDVVAWATYAAIELAVQAELLRSTEGFSLLEAMLDAPRGATLYKGSEVEFDVASQQLMQPLYLVSVVPNGKWSEAVSGRIALAEAIAAIEPSAFQDELSRVAACL